MTRWWPAARELAAPLIAAARERLTHAAALDAMRVERDALATQTEVLLGWYEERGDEVRRLEVEAVERDRAWRAQCELMRDASRDALRLADDGYRDAIAMAARDFDTLSALVSRHCARAVAAEALAVEALTAGLAECERLRVALSTIADRTTDFRAWYAAADALDPGDDGWQPVPERFVAREGDATREELLARLAAAERIANAAMRDGLAECESLRRHVAVLQAEYDRCVDGVSRVARALALHPMADGSKCAEVATEMRASLRAAIATRDRLRAVVDEVLCYERARASGGLARWEDVVATLRAEGLAPRE